jgi:hypothetical protein
MNQRLLIFMRVALSAMACTASANEPNIVYILADDMNYGDVSSCNPDSKIATPGAIGDRK